MRLGYFGGTFDPPHLGHLAVAKAAAEAFALDRVLLVPTGVQPLRPVRPLAPYDDRLAMVSLLCADDAHLRASDLERPRAAPTPNYTIDTLERLQAVEPGAELFVIVGADAFQTLPQWRSPDKLLAVAEWIVVTRPTLTHSALPSLTPEQEERVHVLRTVDHPASATAIRSALASRDADLRGQTAKMLPPEILLYVQQHHLYGQ
jgi:nicotinate-nucleotide adenylyltransferase